MGNESPRTAQTFCQVSQFHLSQRADSKKGVTIVWGGGSLAGRLELLLFPFKAYTALA